MSDVHSCPECGGACYCHGDIDDCEVETEEYSSMHCTHPGKPECQASFGDEDDGDDEALEVTC